MTDTPLDAATLLDLRNAFHTVRNTYGAGSNFEAVFVASKRKCWEASLPVVTALARKVIALEGEAKELRRERDALLKQPIDLAEMDSIDDETDTATKMIAYYWCQQAKEARAASSALEAVITKYASHDDDCDRVLNAGDCTCGFDATLKQQEGGK